MCCRLWGSMKESQRVRCDLMTGQHQLNTTRQTPKNGFAGGKKALWYVAPKYGYFATAAIESKFIQRPLLLSFPPDPSMVSSLKRLPLYKRSVHSLNSLSRSSNKPPRPQEKPFHQERKAQVHVSYMSGNKSSVNIAFLAYSISQQSHHGKTWGL